MTINMKRKQLKLLLNDFELLSKTALTQMQILTKLFEDNTIDILYEEVEQNEIMLDRLEIKVREEVVFTILQFNPIASDLRKIITYQDVTTNLERVGDMILNIIHYVKDPEFKLSAFTEEKNILQKMLKEVNGMLQDAIYSFVNEDTELAYKTIKHDDKVDKMFHQVNKDLTVKHAGKTLKEEDIKALINFSSIAQNFERIGDSATNIAEAAIYLTDGKDIRHGNEKEQ